MSVKKTRSGIRLKVCLNQLKIISELVKCFISNKLFRFEAYFGNNELTCDTGFSKK